MSKYNDLTKPTITMLPMKEIKDEILRSFRNENQIELEKMAVVHDGDLANINDRDTVKNAMLLNGVSSSSYALQTDIEKYDEQAALDLIQLKSELYELKNELIKNNAITHTSVVGGFQDPMKKDHILYDRSAIESKRIVEQAPDNKSILLNTDVEELDNKLNVGDYVSLHLSNKDNIVDRVEDIEGKRLTMENKEFIRRNVRRISSNTGEYRDGYYQFSNTNIDAGSGDIKMSGFNDGRNRTTISLEHSTVALLHTFFVSAPLNNINKGIDSKSKWLLRKTSINATPKTDEGYLTCYILKADDYKKIESIDMQGLISPEGQPGIEVMAKSRPAYASQYSPNVEQEVLFDFTERDNELDPNITYGMLIVHSHNDVDTRYSTYWDITVSHHKGEDSEQADEHKSNSLFSCDYIDDSLSPREEKALDLQYQTFLEEKTHIDLMPHTAGLYTTYFDTDRKVSKALISMRIKKEGLAYYTHEGMSSYVAGSSIAVRNKNKTNFNIANKGDTVIIGNSLRRVSNATTIDGVHNLTLSDDTYIGRPLDTNKVSAYRMGYKIVLTCYSRDLFADKIEALGSTELIATKIIQDDFDNAAKEYSDRIIFETSPEAESLLSKSNYFKIQAVWRSALSDNADLADNQEFIGGIRDLNVSLANTKDITGA